MKYVRDFLINSVITIIKKDLEEDHSFVSLLSHQVDLL